MHFGLSNDLGFAGGRDHGCFSVIPGSFLDAFLSFISMDTSSEERRGEVEAMTASSRSASRIQFIGPHV